MSGTVIQLPGVRHHDEDTVRQEVINYFATADAYDGVISNESAAAIASWYQSPGAYGRHFAALASGAEVNQWDLYRAIVAEMASPALIGSSDEPYDMDGIRSLAALLHWALAQ